MAKPQSLGEVLRTGRLSRGFTARELAEKLLRQARDLGAKTFTPCGAESFMRKDFLDIVELAHALGYEQQDIVTNGTMITDEHLDRLERCPSVQLHVSIDGPREIHDERHPRLIPIAGVRHLDVAEPVRQTELGVEWKLPSRHPAVAFASGRPSEALRMAASVGASPAVAAVGITAKVPASSDT